MPHPTALWRAQCRIPTPLGELSAVCSDTGLVGLWFDGQAHHPGPIDAPSAPQHPHLQAARAWLEAYFEAPAAALPAGPALAPWGSAFQQRVWQALRQIQPGQTLSYGALAAALGSSARAVGTAVGRNPWSVLVPCHRVVGAQGQLTGYAGGLARKRYLLQWEGALGADAAMELETL
ncbi:methylated-DNA--[protein]-cysteine S-methyltransferase [Roseateles sp. BYS180W]|uniref:Methylated-DNA--protein-cysteine methyltransferase n=1 Tax=Roseateles rivi TaxID=3299028 RepID=A0ABW7FSI3_9BURK